MLTDRELMNVIKEFRKSDWVSVRLVQDELDIQLTKRQIADPLPSPTPVDLPPVAGSGVSAAAVASQPRGKEASAVATVEPVTAADAPATVVGDAGPPNLIRAETLGTFWVAPAPGAASFVQPGDTVHVGQQLAIIEVMKLMTEVLAEEAGVIEEVLVENGELVEAGTPLFRVLAQGDAS